MSEELYRGVNRADPPEHPKLISGWQRPLPPEGFEHLVAVLVTIKANGTSTREWMLDYLDPEKHVFASELQEIKVETPWVSGFTPQASDWDAIGIPHMI